MARHRETTFREHALQQLEPQANWQQSQLVEASDYSARPSFRSAPAITGTYRPHFGRIDRV